MDSASVYAFVRLVQRQIVRTGAALAHEAHDVGRLDAVREVDAAAVSTCAVVASSNERLASLVVSNQKSMAPSV